MASSGGHWVKIAQGDIGAMVFVPKGKTVEQVTIGRKPAGGGWPPSLNAVQEVKGLGGSTGAKLVQDENGNLYVMKKGASQAHIQSESSADKLYKEMGVDVPDHRMYGNTKLARYVEGQTLQQAQTNDPAAYNSAIKRLQDNFAADALLANWDVIGLNKDNILIDKKGKVWRIDNGGALAYRAQGAKKSAAGWNNNPTAIFSMRKQGVAGSVFGKMSWNQVAASIDKLPSKIGISNSSKIGARLAKLKDLSSLIKSGMPEADIENYMTALWSGG